MKTDELTARRGCWQFIKSLITNNALFLLLLVTITFLPFPGRAQGTFTAEKGAADSWSDIKVTISNLAKFKTSDSQGWRNNGTEFSGNVAGSGPVTIIIELTARGGISYYDFKTEVMVKVSNVDLLVSDNPVISKDGGTKTYTATWDPSLKVGGVNITVSIMGGNPEFFTYYVRGWIGGRSGGNETQPVSKPPQVKPTRPVRVEPEIRVKSAARFSGMHGQVEVLRAGAGPDDWEIAHLDDVLNVGDHIKTTEDADCILSFADISTFVMKEESEVIILAPPDKEGKWDLVTGNIWVNVKKMMKDGSMEIDLNQAVAGIKGTIFVASTTKTSSTLKVIEGSVLFRSKANGKPVMVSSGESVTATKTGLSAKTRFDIAAISKEWDDVRNHRNAGVNGKEEKIFENGNIYGVNNGPVSPTQFTLSKATFIIRVENYHYFNKGKLPGTITLVNSNGKQFGSWQATGTTGQGGVQNAYWVVRPNINLPAGTYTVIDSDPATWSTNTQSANKGFTIVWAAGQHTP